MRWRLERRGGDVFGLFSVLATDLKGATFPVYVDTAIAEEQVGASDDDGSSASPGTAWNRTLANFYLNRTSTSTYCAGFRFTTVPIPQGATIDSASWTPYIYSAANDSPNHTVYANDVDDAADFSSGRPNQRAYTDAGVSWEGTDIGTGFTQSPDIKAVVQEVVSRDGWASGNNLALLTTDNAGISAFCQVYAWDYTGNARAAKFNCTYTVGGGSAIPAIMHHYRQLRSR
jgi:hypothetical protein